MLEIGDLITLNDDKKYIIIKKVKVNNEYYVCIIRDDGISDLKICQVLENNLSIIKDEDKIKELIEKFK